MLFQIVTVANFCPRRLEVICAVATCLSPSLDLLMSSLQCTMAASTAGVKMQHLCWNTNVWRWVGLVAACLYTCDAMCRLVGCKMEKLVETFAREKEREQIRIRIPLLCRSVQAGRLGRDSCVLDPQPTKPTSWLGHCVPCQTTSPSRQRQTASR